MDFYVYLKTLCLHLAENSLVTMGSLACYILCGLIWFLVCEDIDTSAGTCYQHYNMHLYYVNDSKYLSK